MRWWLVVGVGLIVGCDAGGDAPALEVGRYLIADPAARAAGWQLAGATLDASPRALADEVVVLRGPAGEQALEIPDGAVAHVRGAEAAVEVLALDGDVRADRVQLAGTEAVARELATAAGATAIALGDGRWELEGDEVYGALAALPVPDGLTETVPVPIAAEVGMPAPAWSAAPTRAAAPRSGPAPGPGCEDPLAGVWVARTYRPEARDWHDHELRIARRGDHLVVAGTHHRWAGDKSGGAPPLCDAGGLAWTTTRTEGRAALDAGGRLRVDGVRVVDSVEACAGARGLPYQLDHFTGTVDGDRYLAVNNDGGLAVDRPYTFERVACR